MAFSKQPSKHSASILRRQVPRTKLHGRDSDVVTGEAEWDLLSVCPYRVGVAEESQPIPRPRNVKFEHPAFEFLQCLVLAPFETSKIPIPIHLR